MTDLVDSPADDGTDASEAVPQTGADAEPAGSASLDGSIFWPALRAGEKT
jgi:hypothetical protein